MVRSSVDPIGFLPSHLSRGQQSRFTRTGHVEIHSPLAGRLLRLLPLLLTPLVVLVHGYHPFANDGGLYVAGIRHILNPDLYTRNAVFVTAFTHRSAFPWILAGLARFARLPLSWILLVTHLVSIWLFLFAAGRLTIRIFSNLHARTFAILLASACCTLPVAGTALVLMDPCVTARSFSTPLSLLAVAAALDTANSSRWIPVVVFVAIAIAVHPLMGVYTAAFVLLLALIARARIRTALALCAFAFVFALAAFALSHGKPVDPAYRQAVSLAPRSFLFLARWRWYEILGLVLPLALFALALRRLDPKTPAGALCLTSIALGTTAVLIAGCCVPSAGPFPFVPLQILRSFHLIYCIGVVLCGGILARGPRWIPATFLILLFVTMFLVQRFNWPADRRLELPGLAPANPYTQAFLWIRTHTPSSSVFAFNPELVYQPSENEQGFRAISERDQLADDKDAGVVAVIPSLASRWAAQRNAELSIDSVSDAQRRATIAPLGATWLLLPPSAATALPCPFRNSAVQVCRLTP